MKIRITNKKFDSLDLTSGKVYQVEEMREFIIDEITNVAIDVLDDSGDIETLVNHDEVEYEFV